MSTDPEHRASRYNQAPASLRTPNEWINIRRELSPRYLLAWLSIGLTLLSLFSAMALISLLLINQNSWPLRIVSAVVGAVVIGTIFAHLILWFHEAAHSNIHRNTRLNDLLANLLIGIFVGQDIGRYRQIHFLHHRFLGEQKDPECSYFYHPGLRLIIRSLFGLQVFNALAARNKNQKPSAPNPRVKTMLIAGLGLHGTILTTLWYYFDWLSCAVWMVGVGSIYPMLNALRQSLEHRGPDCAPDDYGPPSGGGYTRNFNASLFSRVIGGAGFRRHAIHHWDPTLSCTRFDDAEKYLAQHTESHGAPPKTYTDTLTYYLNSRIW